MQGETRTATSLTMSMFLRQPLVQRIVTLATGSMTCQLRWMFSSVGHLVRTYRSALKTGANFRIVSRLMFFDRTMMHIELLPYSVLTVFLNIQYIYIYIYIYRMSFCDLVWAKPDIYTVYIQ